MIGIVAGKICESYGRPTILISRDEQSGMGHGSARSTPYFNLLEGLRECADLLAGLEVMRWPRACRIPLTNVEVLAEKINFLAAEVIPEEYLAPRIEVESEVDLAHITRELADTIADMEPFGAGKPGAAVWQPGCLRAIFPARW